MALSFASFSSFVGGATLSFWMAVRFTPHAAAVPSASHACAYSRPYLAANWDLIWPSSGSSPMRFAA